VCLSTVANPTAVSRDGMVVRVVGHVMPIVERLEVERALEVLTGEGLSRSESRSEAARTAILEAERAHRRARLRAEAESLRNDPEDVAASRDLAAEMDALRAW